MKFLTCLLSLTLILPAFGQELKKLGVADVKVNAAVVESAKAKGLSNSLDRSSQALDSLLINAFQQSRKFEVIARSDLASLLKEADFSGGKFQISGVNYLVVTTIDDFQDFKENRIFAALGKTVTARVIRLATIAKVYDSTTGKLVESTNFITEQREQQDTSGASQRNGDLTDQYLRGVSEEMAAKISIRVSDVIYPVRILSVLDKQVTINRGDGSSVTVGQVWNIFAQGQELVDPDTGASLGREELLVGKVRITQVNPKTSQGEIIEDKGRGEISRLAVLRPVVTN